MVLRSIRPAGVGAGLAVRLTLPLVLYLALRIFVDAQRDPLGSLEGAYLALLASGVLATVSALATRPWTAGWAALVTAGAIVVLPDGSRGAVVVPVLVAALAVAAGERWRAEGGRLGPTLTVPLALGAQLLFRGDLLLPPLLDARTVVSVAVLPAIAGLAASLLAATFGSRRVLLAATAAAVLTPGWNLTTTATLAVLAAGVIAADPVRPRWLRLAAGVALAASALWRPPAGLLIALAGLTTVLLARRPGAGDPTPPAMDRASSTRRGSDDDAEPTPAGLAAGDLAGRAIVAALTAVVLAAAFFPVFLPWPAARDGSAATTLLLAAALLLPALPAAIVRPWRAVAGVTLAVAAARLVADVAALAPGITLAALALPFGGLGARVESASGSILGRLQGWWLGVVTAGTAVLAAYPWLRVDPRGDALALAGLTPTPATVVLLALAVTAAGLAADRLATVTADRPEPNGSAYRFDVTPRRARVVRLGLASLFAASLFVAVVREAPRILAVPLERPVTLDAERDGVARRLVDLPATSEVAIDTSLVRGTDLPSGTPVGVVLLLDGEQRTLARWPLRAGVDTAEWAIDRADVAARVRAPPPWRATLAPGVDFFFRRFRSRFAAETPVDAGWMVVRRSSRLPDGVELLVYRVEIRR